MTIERFFHNLEAVFSGYEDVSSVDPSADRYVWFYTVPYGADAGLIANQVESYLDLLKLTLSRLPAGKTLIVMTMQSLYQIDTLHSDFRIAQSVDRYNATLYELAQDHDHLKVIDFSDFLNRFPRQDWIDWKYYFVSQMNLNPRLASAFHKWFSLRIQAIDLQRKKCLVLDLDNTLWGGILGEEGIRGIALGGTYPGNAFRMFQQQLSELARQGVILTVCSKNNYEEVLLAWREHPDMVLRENDFAAWKIDWTNKANNIGLLAEELNIGLDSMVFLDDNPSERDLVRRMLPTVAVPEFPAHPYLLPEFFKEIAETYFSIYSLTLEDMGKTAQYKANAQRNSAKSQFSDLSEYIKSLEIKLDIEEAGVVAITRVAQMTQKTNQFNLTTRRYSESEIGNFLLQGDKVYTLAVKDKFGDNGITGACIVRLEGNTAEIDSLLLSCRILGKNIEQAFVSSILRKLQRIGIKTVTAQYIPTPKNAQVIDFYDRLGFQESLTEASGTKFYRYDLESAEITLSNNYQYE